MSNQQSGFSTGSHVESFLKILEVYKRDLEDFVPVILGEVTLPPEMFIDVGILQAFVCVDLWGYLYSAKGETTDAVKFMRRYLGNIDPRYKEASGLLYTLLRHGWVHRKMPKRLKLAGGEVLDFSFKGPAPREEHLSLKKDANGNLRLLISVYLLYQDLGKAIDLYLVDLSNDQDLFATMERAVKTIRQPESEEDFRKRQYIDASDLEFVRRQLTP